MNTLSRQKGKHSILKNYDLYLLLVPVIAYFVIFHYVPMYGTQIAFKDFMVSKGIWGSPWVGLEHFERFFRGYYAERVIVNTIMISAYTLALTFICPILLALMLNEINSPLYKRTIQTVTYAPYFLSVVVLYGMMVVLLSPTNGLVNNVIRIFGGEPVAFLVQPKWFKTVYALSDAWQNTGFNSIIYLAALSAIDPELHEAAQIDGASRLRRIWHINVPGILPTIVILLILNCGRVMNVSFEKVFLMQNGSNLSASDVISTYVYRMGIQNVDYGFSAAVGLFNSAVNLLLLTFANRLGKLASGTSLF